MIGLTVASTMFVVFAVIVWRSLGTDPTTASPSVFPDNPAEIPNLADLEQGASMLVTIVDREDPTRIAGTLQADQFEPIGGGQRRLVNPDAWIYQRDGRRIHITADNGLVMMPDPNSAPESGTLEGNVTIRAYEAGDFDLSTDPLDRDSIAAIEATLEPAMVARFEKPVEFERRYQRLNAEGRFTIDSPGVSFAGHELTVMLNEVKNRVELIEVQRGEQLIIRPEAMQSAALTDSNAQPFDDQNETEFSGSEASGVQEVAAEVQVPQETAYHIAFSQNVFLDLIGSGDLRAEKLDIWALLIDGALSDEAVRQISFAATEQNDDSGPSTKQSDSTPAAATPSSPQQNIAIKPAIRNATDGQLVMTWDGPLVVRPIEQVAGTMLESGDEQLALAFTSSASRVELASPGQGFTGSADQLNYGATTGTLGLIGSQQAPLTLASAQGGRLETLELSANLDSGLINIDSAGELESVQGFDQSDSSQPGSSQPGAEPNAQIVWQDRAEFGLVKTEANELTARLKSAAFEGGVRGTRADALVTADSLLAELDAVGPVESALRKISMVNGSMRADAGSLAGEQLAIGFIPILGDPDATGVTPSTLLATGAVLGISQDGRIETESLDALMVREFDGQTRVRRATAIGNTSFLGQRDTRASGERFVLDTDNDTVQIFGTQLKQASAGQAGSTIEGQDIWMNTRSRSVKVNGAGSFDHDIVTQGVATGGHLRVTWEESMRFDDAIGSIECKGDVVAVSTPDAYTLDTVKADRLQISLTPAPGTDQITSPDQLLDGSDNEVDRELYLAKAFGRAIPGQDPVLASVESRTYDPANPERAIGVMYLEGAQLIADNRAQTLSVPAKGMMVLMDRSEDAAGGQAGASTTVMPNTSGPGLTSMTWLGSMKLDRATGNALVLQEVNIRHKSLTTGRVSQLGTDRLEAEFTGSSGGDAATPVTMYRADASGRVRFTDLQRTLLSDYAIYDASAETMFAFADDDRLVTLRDLSDPTPISAKTLLWDLKRDLVEIDAPTPVRAPSRP